LPRLLSDGAPHPPNSSHLRRRPAWPGKLRTASPDRMDLDRPAITVATVETVHTRLDGEALRRARSEKGLTHHQLARQVRLGAGERILKLERGATEPSPRLIVELAEALAVEPVQLLLLPNGVDLQALRLIAGRSAADLASSVHVSLRSYLQWESGQGPPLRDGRILAALARELHVPTDRIMTAFAHNAGPEPDNNAPSQ